MLVRFRTPAFLLIGLVLASCSPPSEAPAGQEAAGSGFELAPRLDAYLENAMERLEIPGLTIALVRDDEIVYERAFGVRSLDSGEPVTTRHLFHMASVSKPFVATAVVQLHEKGKIDLDASVTTYLPYFELDDERYPKITIRQMLNHTSGMPDVRDYEWGSPQVDDGAAERYVRSLGPQKMLSAPGETSRYSNMAFDVLGDVIAKVSGVSFETYVKDNILDPLGMTESHFLYPATREDLRTSGHVWRLAPVVSDVYPYNRRHAPSSTLNSNIVEMSRWVRANLNRGELEGRRILEAASYDLLWTPSARMRERTEIGLSWFLGEAHGTRTISHGGGDTGFNSGIDLLPEKGIGLVVAANYDRSSMGQIRAGLMSILLGAEPEALKTSVATAFAKVYLDQGLEAAKAHYRQLESEARDRYQFGNGHLNGLGYAFLGQDRNAEAIEIFRYNAELYPEVGNCWDSLGEAYMADGQDALAVESYQKALELEPDNANAREMLTRLGV